MKILPALKKIHLDRLVKLSGIPRRALIDIRSGESRTHRKNQQILGAIVQSLELAKHDDKAEKLPQADVEKTGPLN